MRQEKIPDGMSYVEWQDSGARIFKDLFFKEQVKDFKDRLHEKGGMVLKVVEGDD
jgi:hypothetical protein